jgi:uncharacterized protein YbaR (Trm112 family)/ubiquinone/menaquinone biosynthesis C-methylase UbiE
LTDQQIQYVCPLTKLPLELSSAQDARTRIARGEPLLARTHAGATRTPVGETQQVLIRNDERAAYPIVDGVPILLAPEVLTAPGERPHFDLSSSHYAEAYSEMQFYDAVAAREVMQIRAAGDLSDATSEGVQGLGRLHRLSVSERATFPFPSQNWLLARMDLASEWDCYIHLAPVQGKHIVQLGGTGVVAMSLLLAGAARTMLLTPMLGEAKVALELARKLDVSERFDCFVGVAEEIPLSDASVDGAFSGGCVHHMTTSRAFPEIARVLKPGGRFAAIEPWRAPFYAFGTSVFGKREANPFCRPMTSERVAPLFKAFSRARYVQHGTLSRYPMLAMEKVGVRFPVKTAWAVGRLDDRLCSFIPGMRSLGSGVALLATK